jgi:nucleotide-binding universal stress UspA family protein
MNRVVVAYDGSKCSDEVLKDLERAGLPPEMEAIVLAVADVWLPDDSDLERNLVAGPPNTRTRATRGRAMQALKSSFALAERACDQIRSLFPQWKVEALACADSPSWAIVRKALEWKADLVALGAHSRSLIERLFLGSVAQRVATEAACSVRIVRPRLRAEHAPLRLAIAIDGSPDSEATVQAVARRVWPANTEFSVVAVVDQKMETTVAWPGVLTERRESAGNPEVDEWIWHMTRQAATCLRDAGLNAKAHVFDGDSKTVLLREIDILMLDCVFLGARGVHHGDRSFLGSLASAVATRAPCSVEIIRPE